MTGHPELLQRIERFDIDGGERPAFGFAARLAAENGWSRAFAERVVGEYKRYVYLAMTHGRPVCPSDQVDEAWHLHLTYTRSYWLRLCRDTLGRDLHHEPTRGGEAEDDKHWRMYEDTLDAYRAAFGNEPPADIWPPVAERFPAMRAVHAPARFSAFALASVSPLPLLLAAAALVAAWSYLGAVNPYSMRGTSFFWFFIPALIAALVIGRFAYPLAREKLAKPYRRFRPLDWDETAYVAGGSGRLSSAAMARLVGAGHIRVSNDLKELQTTGKPTDGLSPVEHAVLAHMPISKGRKETGASFKAMEQSITSTFATKAAALAADGVILGEQARRRLQLLVLLPMLLLLALVGLPRLVMGLSNGRPVLLLVFAMVVGLIAALVLLASIDKGPRTPKGDEQLEKLRQQHAALEKNAGLRAAGPAVAIGAAAGLGVALFGMSAVANSEIAELSDLDVFLPARQHQASGCGGGCGSGGGGAGGDGGGGGCGGGD